MSFKSKAIGLFATAVLCTTMFGGTVLAEDANTKATLNMNPNGVCSASAGVSPIDFGTYHWNGVDHFVTDVPPVLNFTVTSTYGPGTGCDVSISASNLTKVGGTATITNADLQLNSLTGTGAQPTPKYLAYGYKFVKNGTGSYSGAMQLNGVWRAPGSPLAYEVGSYTGTLTFTSTLGTP